MRSTNIYLALWHYEWRDKNAVNLSAWVRNKIDAEIAKRNKLVKMYEITGWLSRTRDFPTKIKAVELKVRPRAILVDPLEPTLDEVWLPRSQIKNEEVIGLYKDEVNYPR